MSLREVGVERICRVQVCHSYGGEGRGRLHTTICCKDSDAQTGNLVKHACMLAVVVCACTQPHLTLRSHVITGEFVWVHTSSSATAAFPFGPGPATPLWALSLGLIEWSGWMEGVVEPKAPLVRALRRSRMYSKACSRQKLTMPAMTPGDSTSRSDLLQDTGTMPTVTPGHGA